MKFKIFSVPVLGILILISGIFFKTEVSLASCNPQQGQGNPPSIDSISGPVGNYTNPSTIPIIIQGDLGYECQGTGGFGWDTYSADVTYAIKDSSGSQIHYGYWTDPGTCNVPICLPQTMNINTLVEASSWPAGNYTIDITAVGPTMMNPEESMTVTATRNFTITRTPSGTLTPSSSSCTIASGQSSCTKTLTWTTTNSIGTSAVTNNGTATPASPDGNNSSAEFTVPYNSGMSGVTTFYLHNNGIELALAAVTTSCASGTAWNGTICVPIPVVTVTATPASVGYGQTSTISWTAPNATSCTYNGYEVAAPNGSFSTDTLTTTTIFEIYCNNVAGTASSNATVTVAGSPSGTLSLSSCTIASGASACTTALTVATQNLNSPNASNTMITRNPAGTCTNCAYPFTSPITASVSFGTTNFYLYHAGAMLATDSVTPTCATNTTWSLVSNTCEPNQVLLSVSKAGTGTGTVSASPAGIDCGAICSASYDYNTSVTLTATPAEGSTFTIWSGACSGGGACVVSMTQARNVTATFSNSPTMSGNLTPESSSCTIQSGGNSCTKTLTWTTINPLATSAVTNDGTATPASSSGNNSSAKFTIPYKEVTNGRTFFYLYNNAQQLDIASVDTFCDIGNAWDGDSCEPIVGMSGTLSGSNCSINEGENSCTTNLSWAVLNGEGQTTAITANGMDDIIVSPSGKTNPTSGTANVTVPFNSRTFYLYNNARSLVPYPNGEGVVISATCEAGTVWNGLSCVSSTNPTNGICATPPNGVSYTTAPLGPLCSSGIANPSALSGKGDWNWVCKGSDGGSDSAQCTAFQSSEGCASMKASPATIFTGGSTKLTWSSCATSCSGTNFDTGGEANDSAGISVSPAVSTTYAIACDDKSNSTASVNVIVKKRPILMEN